jgi:hypothetical protein
VVQNGREESERMGVKRRKGGQERMGWDGMSQVEKVLEGGLKCGNFKSKYMELCVLCHFAPG